jgi:hypothetical protein
MEKYVVSVVWVDAGGCWKPQMVANPKTETVSCAGNLRKVGLCTYPEHKWEPKWELFLQCSACLPQHHLGHPIKRVTLIDKERDRVH